MNVYSTSTLDGRVMTLQPSVASREPHRSSPTPTTTSTSCSSVNPDGHPGRKLWTFRTRDRFLSEKLSSLQLHPGTCRVLFDLLSLSSEFSTICFAPTLAAPNSFSASFNGNCAARLRLPHPPLHRAILETAENPRKTALRSSIQPELLMV